MLIVNINGLNILWSRYILCSTVGIIVLLGYFRYIYVYGKSTCQVGLVVLVIGVGKKVHIYFIIRKKKVVILLYHIGIAYLFE